jgi:hypothetical protein
MSVKLTKVAKHRVYQQQHRQGYAWGQQWGARLRPLSAPARWYRRLRSSHTR